VTGVIPRKTKTVLVFAKRGTVPVSRKPGLSPFFRRTGGR
jgi:hypothetical protein